MNASSMLRAFFLPSWWLLMAPFSLANESLSITIQQPLNEAQYLAPALPEFSVGTFAPNAFLTHVELFANGEFIGTLRDCPINEDCADPVPGTPRELRHFFPSADRSSGLISGRHLIVARGSIPGSETVFESEPVEIFVRQELPSAPLVSFIQPEYEAIYQIGEPIPLQFESYVPNGRLPFAEVFANGKRIGHASDCPPNADCVAPPAAQINSLMSFYQDRAAIADWGYWVGAEPGRHLIKVRGETLSETIPIIVTEVVASEKPQFILPVSGHSFALGEPIPIELTMIMPEAEFYGILSVTVGEQTIGYLDHCPPNADCGSPTPGSFVRLKFYPVELRDPWESWTPNHPGEYTLRLTSEDPDTGALSFGDQVTIKVGTELRLSIHSAPALQLAVPEPHRIEASTDLIEWTPLAFPDNTTAITLDPSASPTQFFRLVAP